MKKLLLLISLCFIPAFGHAFEFNSSNSTFPQAQFASVNISRYNNTYISYQAHISAVGAASPYDNGQANVSYSSRPRRVKDNPGDPFASPVGDLPIAYMFILCIILCFLINRKEKEKNSSLSLNR